MPEAARAPEGVEEAAEEDLATPCRPAWMEAAVRALDGVAKAVAVATAPAKEAAKCQPPPMAHG